jgi:Raf kinase inhibitor-like YbhB/YbcL family protein
MKTKSIAFTFALFLVGYSACSSSSDPSKEEQQGSGGGGGASAGASSGGNSATGGTSNGGAAGSIANSGGQAGAVVATGGAGGGGGKGGAGGVIGAGGMAGVGGAGGVGGVGGSAGATPVVFSITSTAYTEGQMIPPKHTCAGANTSPALAWTAGPATTKSYALIFQDNTNKYVHWVIWDIPTTTLSLAESLPGGATLQMPAGAKQAAFQNLTAFQGPCPGGNEHNYSFTVYAMNTTTLGHTAGTDPPGAATKIRAAALQMAALSGKSNAKRP